MFYLCVPFAKVQIGMAYLDQFSIPVKGLQVGKHEYHYQVDNQFFGCFEGSMIQHGAFNIDVVLIKNIDMMIVEIAFTGFWNTGCDRCLANIQLPLKDQDKYLIKYAEKESDEGDILFISRETTELNLSKLIFESICISLPVKKTYDCENEVPRPCDMKVLDKLGLLEDTGAVDPVDNIWSSLSHLQLELEEE